MGIIPLKILEEISIVGSVCHRWIRGTERHLEQLMMFRGLRNVSNNYEACKTTLLHV